MLNAPISLLNRFTHSLAIAVALLLVTGCGGGGGDSAPTDPAQIATNLATNGGGIGGAAVSSGGSFTAKAIESGSKVGLAGVGVCLNDASGAVITSGVTDPEGNALFTELASVPHSVTFVDPVTNSAETVYGSVANPLRSVIVQAFERSPSFEVTVTGIVAGSDLQLVMNGTPVGARDNCAETEVFSISSALEGDFDFFNLASTIAGGELVSANQKWLLIAHEYANENPGTPDSQILIRAAWISDSSGTAGGTTATLTLDIGTGVGTAAPDLSSGVCTIGTATGNVTFGSSQFGLIPTMAGVPNMLYSITNTFGTFTYNRLMVDVDDLQSSVVAPLPITGWSGAFSVSYPIVPATLTGAAWTSETRAAQVALGPLEDFLAIAQGDLEGLTELLQSLTILSRQTVRTTVGGAANISFNSLGSLGPATVTANITTDTVNSVAVPGLVALLVGQVDANTYFVSLDVTGAATVAFPAIGGTSAMPVQSAWIAVFSGGGDGMGGELSGVTMTHMPRGPVTGLTSITSGGNPTVSVNYSLGGNLTLTNINPTGTSTTFDVANDSIEWTASGIGARMGIFDVNLVLDTGTATAREWNFTLNRAAVSVAGGSSYALRIPQLPASAPFAGLGVTAATSTMAVQVEYVDTTAAGIDPNNFHFGQVATPPVSPFLPTVVGGLPRISMVGLIQPAVVDPE